MTYKIEYLPSALRDLTEIADYIGVKLSNPEAAERLSENIVSTIDKLAEMQYKYPVCYPIAAFFSQAVKNRIQKNGR